MNLIEALKQANGKPVRRRGWAVDTEIKESCGGIAARSSCHKEWDEGGGGFLIQCKGNIFANDWYVVEPKSRIEEAIERELPDESKGYLKAALSRIANVALDEAKRCIGSNETGMARRVSDISELIEALKVK